MPPSRPKFRLSVQAKVLLVVISVLVLLPALLVWIVDRHTSRLVQDQARQQLATSAVFLQKSVELRAHSYLDSYRNKVLEPSFKAAVSLQDAATMNDYLRRMLTLQGDEGVALLFYYTKDEMFASTRQDDAPAPDSFARAAAPLVGAAFHDVEFNAQISLSGRVYTVVALPVSLREGGPVLGVFAAFIPVGKTALNELKNLTDAEIVLIAGDEALDSTLPAGIATGWLRTLPPADAAPGEDAAPVLVGGVHYLARTVVEPGTAARGPRYLLLSSYEESVRSLADTRQTLVLVSVGGILLSTLVVWFFVSRITQPLRELRDNAEAIGRGDFSRRIERFPADECGDLAVAFNGMTASLQSSRTQLEKTVETLKGTQVQLIQSEKLSAVGQFVAGVAHELNNPLTAVIGFADLLEQTVTDSKIRGHLSRISSAAHRCHKIVHSLLSFARQHQPERRLVHVNALVEEVLEIMAYDLRTTNIKVVREFAPGLPPLMADPHQLQQVFINILGNARQALQSARQDGMIVVRLVVAGGVLRVEFEDNGPGIRPENLAKIFDPFFTTKPVGKGTGLGLSLSYGIIQEHGGRIFARSEFGRGANFIIELPVAVTDLPSALRRDSSAPFLAPPVIAGTAVLLIDDEESILALGREVLEGAGYTVESVGSGELALTALGRRGFDVIVCDWKMPGMSGIQLYEHLAANDAAAAGRMIFMTGDVINERFEEFLRRHGRTCLNKPFDIGHFRAAVASVVGRIS